MAVDLLGIARLNQQKENQKRDTINDLMNLFQGNALKTDTNEEYDVAIGNIQKLQGQDKFMDLVGNEHINRLQLEKEKNVVKDAWLAKVENARTLAKKPYDPNNPTAFDDLLFDLSTQGANLTNGATQSEINVINQSINQLKSLEKSARVANEEQIYAKAIEAQNPAFKPFTDIATKTKTDDTDILRGMFFSPVKQSQALQTAQAKKSLDMQAKIIASPDKYAGYDPAKTQGVVAQYKDITAVAKRLNTLKTPSSSRGGASQSPVFVPDVSIWTGIDKAIANQDTDAVKVAYNSMARHFLSLIPRNVVDTAFQDLEEGGYKFSYIDKFGQKTTSDLKSRDSKFEDGRIRLEWVDAFYEFAKSSMEPNKYIGADLNVHDEMLKELLQEDDIATKVEMIGMQRFTQDFYSEPLFLLKEMDEMIKGQNKKFVNPKYNSYSKRKAFRPD